VKSFPHLSVQRTPQPSRRPKPTASDTHTPQPIFTSCQGASPSVRTLAERIINAQQDEIATMQHWLRDRQQPVPDAVATGMRMQMNGMEHEMLMPGMLTDAQMKELDAARGPEFDRLFLTDMIQHHRGAVTMVKQLFDSYGAGQDETVFKFASDVNVDQTTEIGRMQKMLVALTLGVETP
jgi:uncharacterized protein (DUF305 family)